MPLSYLTFDLLCDKALYNNYLVPNDLVNNTEYMANKAVPDILKALSKRIEHFYWGMM